MKTIKIASFDEQDVDYNSVPSSPFMDDIYFRDPETDEEAEARVLVYFDVEPTEYEGHHVFYQGGYIVNEIKLAEPVTIGGRTYSVGTDTDDLIQYLDKNYKKNWEHSLAVRFGEP